MSSVRSLGWARFVVGVTLAAWGSPVAASLAVSVHLAFDHHHGHEVAPTALAMAHGHQHDLNVPPHRHDATANDLGTFRAPSASSEPVGSPVALADAGCLVTVIPLDRANSPPPPVTPSPLRL